MHRQTCLMPSCLLQPLQVLLMVFCLDFLADEFKNKLRALNCAPSDVQTQAAL